MQVRNGGKWSKNFSSMSLAYYPIEQIHAPTLASTKANWSSSVAQQMISSSSAKMQQHMKP
jgi:hypothetical protein